MAGAGYKLFNTGDVLTAAQVNTYLQEQAVMRFANAAARTTALSGVLAEGMVSYLMDTNAVEVYDGSAWVGVATGDITAVTAGTGISGGGTSGAVTITNSMATEITAAGDIIVGTGSGTFDNLPIGTTGQVLTADTTVSPYKVKWASAASGGGFTLINSGGTTLSGSSTSVSSIPTTYRNLHIYVEGFYAGSNNNNGRFQFNSETGDNYAFMGLRRSGGNAEATATEGNNDTGIYFASVTGTSDTGNFAYLMIPNYGATTHRKTGMGVSYTKNDGSPGDYYVMQVFGVLQNSSSAITSVEVVSNGSWGGGKVYVYGES